MRFALFIFGLLFLIGCSASSAPEPHPIIASYSNSYNTKDLETMQSHMHPDIEWLSVEGGTITTETSGKAELSAAMADWFKTPDLPRGSLRDWSVSGDYVAVTETAHWTNKAGEAKSQSALTVYQLEGNLIRRVYYYPAAQP